MDDVHAACSQIHAQVVVLPPIQQGDILRMSHDLPSVIAIVDGYFFQVPSVLHKEILFALERGVRVVGAASLGALRAAELDVFGMEGIGTIFEMYKRGTIDGDDEVAVLHGGPEDGYRPLTEPLVNVRYNLQRARRERSISAPTARIALRAAGQMHFTERSLRALLDRLAGEEIPARELPALRRALQDEAVDLKRQDALLLLRRLAERSRGEQSWPEVGTTRLNRTSHYLKYQRQYVGRCADGEAVPDADVLAFEQVLSPTFPALFRRVARRCLMVEVALAKGLLPAPASELYERFRQRRSLHAEEALGVWLERRGFSLDELLQHLRERDLERRLLGLYCADDAMRRRESLQAKLEQDLLTVFGSPREHLVRPLFMRPGVAWSEPLLRELKARGEYPAALRRAARIRRFAREFAERNPWLQRFAPSEERLKAWCAERWDVAVESLAEARFDRGIVSEEELLAAVGPSYLWEEFGLRQASETGNRASAAPAAPG